MAKEYKPKVGDIVRAQGQSNIFKVISISKKDVTTEIQPFLVGKRQTYGKVMKHIPRLALSPFKEDSSQAALRVVREATEGK
jgi:hypothetical protein